MNSVSAWDAPKIRQHSNFLCYFQVISCVMYRNLWMHFYLINFSLILTSLQKRKILIINFISSPFSSAIAGWQSTLDYIHNQTTSAIFLLRLDRLFHLSVITYQKCRKIITDFRYSIKRNPDSTVFSSTRALKTKMINFDVL